MDGLWLTLPLKYTVFLCKSSPVWLILMSISGRGMTSTGTKDFGWLDPFTAQNLTSCLSKQGGIWLSLLRDYGFRVENEMVLNLGANSSISNSFGGSRLDWYTLSFEFKGQKMAFFCPPMRSRGRNNMECYKWLNNRYYMWMQPHNLLLKRLTVYLSAILKTLFENKVFDTILPPLCQCFCELLSWFT